MQIQEMMGNLYSFILSNHEIFRLAIMEMSECTVNYDAKPFEIGLTTIQLVGRNYTIATI